MIHCAQEHSKEIDYPQLGIPLPKGGVEIGPKCHLMPQVKNLLIFIFYDIKLDRCRHVLGIEPNIYCTA